MISKQEEEGRIDPDSSLSFNVTRDLDADNEKKNNYIVYEESDKVMRDYDSGEDQLEDSQDNPKQVYVLPHN